MHHLLQYDIYYLSLHGLWWSDQRSCFSVKITIMPIVVGLNIILINIRWNWFHFHQKNLSKSNFPQFLTWMIWKKRFFSRKNLAQEFIICFVVYKSQMNMSVNSALRGKEWQQSQFFPTKTRVAFEGFKKMLGSLALLLGKSRRRPIFNESRSSTWTTVYGRVP